MSGGCEFHTSKVTRSTHLSQRNMSRTQRTKVHTLKAFHSAGSISRLLRSRAGIVASGVLGVVGHWAGGSREGPSVVRRLHETRVAWLWFLAAGDQEFAVVNIFRR